MNLDPVIFDRLEELLRQNGVDVQRIEKLQGRKSELEACFLRILEECPNIRLQLIREQIEDAILILDFVLQRQPEDEDVGDARWDLQQALELIPKDDE